LTAEQKQVRKQIKTVDEIISIIKAKGGWKYRKEIPLTDLQLNKRMKTVEDELNNLAVSLAIAETMLKEPPPSIHSRWDEYQRRRQEAIIINNGRGV